MRGATTVAFALGGVLVLAGCGGGRYSSPRNTFRTMWAAAKAGDKEALMACFSKATRESIAEAQKAAQGAFNVADMMVTSAKKTEGEPEVGEQKIEGDKATLEVTMAVEVAGETKRKTETLHFVNEEGGWRVHFPDMPSAAEIRQQAAKMTDEQRQRMRKAGEAMRQMMQKGQ